MIQLQTHHLSSGTGTVLSHERGITLIMWSEESSDLLSPGEKLEGPIVRNGKPQVVYSWIYVFPT